MIGIYFKSFLLDVGGVAVNTEDAVNIVKAQWETRRDALVVF